MLLQSVNTVQQNKVFFPQDQVIHAPGFSLLALNPNFESFIHTQYTPEIARCMYRKPCDTFSETKQRIYDDVDKMIEGTLSSFVICVKSIQNPVGCAMLHHKKASPKIELWIAKKDQRKGHATEAIFALKKFAKENLRNHAYLTAIVSAQNDPAICLMNKLKAKRGRHTTYKYNEAGEKGELLTFRLYH